MAKPTYPGRAVLTAVLCLLMFAFCFSACGGSPKSEQYDLAEQTEYVRPDTRELITDPTLLSGLDVKNTRVWFSDFTLEELQSPVALILRDEQEDEYDFCQTDLFETTKDLSEAKSVVLLKIFWRGEHVEHSDAIRRYTPRVDCYVSSPDLSVRTKVQEFTLTEDAVYGELSYKAHFNAELDRKIVRQLSEAVTIRSTADNAFVDVMVCLGLFDNQKDVDLLRTVCQGYGYPETENLATHPELVDPELPLNLYGDLSVLYLEDPDPSRYSTPDDLFSDSVPSGSVNETLEAWSGYCSGRTTRLIGLIEYIGGNSAGKYYYQNSSSNVIIYAPIYRVTVADVNAGRVIAWYENRSVKLEKEEIFSSKVKESHGAHYYNFYDPVKDFIETVLHIKY